MNIDVYNKTKTCKIFLLNNKYCLQTIQDWVNFDIVNLQGLTQEV